MKRKGFFIVVEGADGVGKSTILKLILPQLLITTKFSGTLFFHWKPVKREIHRDCIPDTLPHNPRGYKTRTSSLSLVFLCYHWLSFFIGYLKFILPAKRKGKLIIGDRYTYDLLLDPQRFRLNLPSIFLRFFVWTLPKPDIVLALVASPEIIVTRKQELSAAEIHAYQSALLALPIQNLIVIQAEASPETVAARCLEAITPHITTDKTLLN